MGRPATCEDLMFDMFSFAPIIIWIYTIAHDQSEMSCAVASSDIFDE